MPDAELLCVLFDLVKTVGEIVTFHGTTPPPYDVYSPKTVRTRGALPLLERHGLAHAEQFGDRTFYRLDQAARDRMGV